MNYSETFTFGTLPGQYPPSTIIVDSFFRHGEIIRVEIPQTTAVIQFQQNAHTRTLVCPNSDFQPGDAILVTKELQ